MLDLIKNLAVGFAALMVGLFPHAKPQLSMNNTASPSAQIVNQIDNTPTPSPQQSWSMEQQNTFINACQQDGSNQNMCACTLQYFQVRYSPDEYIKLLQQFKGVQNPSVWVAAKNYCNSSNQQTKSEPQPYQNQYKQLTPESPSQDSLNPTNTSVKNTYNAPKSYTGVGNSLYGSDGSSYTQTGKTIYENDGTSYTSNGNALYGSDGSTYSKVGNTTYSNNGTSYSRVGNTIYGSDGSSATSLGNTIYTYPGH